jgi:hypothetical protein
VIAMAILPLAAEGKDCSTIRQDIFALLRSAQRLLSPGNAV